MNQTLIVTGANSGIGMDIARRALELGWNVIATSRDPAKIDLSGERLRKIRLDVASDESVRAFSQELFSIPLEGVMSLVNNAGLAVSGPVETVPIADWEKQLQTNVIGVVRLVQTLLPKIRETRGRIVNIGSVSGRMANPFLGPYAASKFGLRGLTDSLRREMKPFGVSVSLVEPGPIQTPLWERSKKDGNALKDSMTTEMKEIYGKRLEIFEKAAMSAAAGAIPVERATNAVFKALTDRNPRPYYSTSAGHFIQSALGTVVPATLVDRLIGSAFRVSRRPR